MDDGFIGDGYLDEYDVIFIAVENGYIFFHATCVEAKLGDGICNHKECQNNFTLAYGITELPMYITKYMYCVPETLNKMKLAALNEPFMEIREDFREHPSLFVNKEIKILEVSNDWSWNYAVPMILRCPCCNKLIDSEFIH